MSNTITAAMDAVTDILPGIRKNAFRHDREASFPSDNLRLLRENGLLGLLVPAEHGGLGGSLGDMVTVASRLASACLSTAMIWAMHCQQVDALVRFATPDLAESLLPRIAAGHLYLASITTEPGSGGTLLRSGATMSEDSDSMWVDRQAPIVTGGEYADGFLVTMRSAHAEADSDVTLVYLAREQVTLEHKSIWDAMGMRATRSGGMHLSGSVPLTQTVGGDGQFRTVAVESMIPAAHLGWSACWLGATHEALSQLTSMVREKAGRDRTGPPNELQAERLARVRIEVELVNAYLQRVLAEVLAARAAGESVGSVPQQIHINNLKVIASERCFAAIDAMIQIGGLTAGYLCNPDFPLERTFRDLRAAALNYANDRLLVTNGRLALLDRAVQMP